MPTRRHQVYTTKPLVDGVFQTRVAAHLFPDCVVLQTWAQNSLRGPVPVALQATEHPRWNDDSPYGQRVTLDDGPLVDVCLHCVRRAWKTGAVKIGYLSTTG